MRRLDIRTPSVDAPVGTLSGGNQQKVQVGPLARGRTRILLLVDPTHGVDVGARAEIYALLRRARRRRLRPAARLRPTPRSSSPSATASWCCAPGARVGELAGAALTEARLLHRAAGA